MLAVRALKFQRAVIAAACAFICVSILVCSYHLSAFELSIHYVISKVSGPPAPPPIVPIGRENDYTDIFRHFKGHRECGFGATDLHKPLPRLCYTRQGLFNAMSYGRRAGFNKPFEPLGCDLHFFTTAEICEILGRFEGVIFLGDSLIRQTEWAVAMLLQENYFDGGQSSWLDPKSKKPCTCEHQAFSWQCLTAETSVELLYKNEPEKILCPNRPQLNFRYALSWPLNQTDLDMVIAEVTREERPKKPYAFVLGHAGWNDVNATATLAWVDQVMASIPAVRPYLGSKQGLGAPVAFVSLSAAGPDKPKKWIATQGNEAVPRYQALIREPILQRGLDFLSPFNMSLQATIPDGTHVGIRINLLKAMTLINWLNMVGTTDWHLNH